MKFRTSFSGVKLFAVSMAAIASLAMSAAMAFAATYTWNQTGTASFATATNWTPSRTVLAASDVLVFSNGATTTATGVTTQTIAQLLVSGSTNVTLQGAVVTGTATLSVGGLAGTDLDVPAGSSLNASNPAATANAVAISILTGATGSVSGTMTFSASTINTPHQLLAADAGSLTFNSGSSFTQLKFGTGSPFGTTGTANAVIFASGSLFDQISNTSANGGANPFGLTQPASRVTFQSGSLFKYEIVSGTPAFSGRNYADLEINTPAGTSSPTGGSAVTMNNFTVTAGTLNFGSTANPGHSIKGNILVAVGATLNFNTAAAGVTINFNGTTPQSITNNGTLTFSPAGSSSFIFNGSAAQSITNTGTFSSNNFQTFSISNASGVSLGSNLTIGNATAGGGVTFTAGKINTGANTLTIASGASITGAGSGTGYVNGKLQKTVLISASVGNQTWQVGDASLYAPIDFATTTGATNIVLTGSTTPGDHGNIATSGLDASKSVNRFYTLATNSGSFGNANLTFNFNNPADIDAGTSPTTLFYVKKFDGPSTWTSPTTGARTATSTQATGVTGFSDFAIGELADHTITASAGAGGSISPSGAVSVANHANQAFSISPSDKCHVILDVLVDNVSVGAVATYTFTDVTVDHTISASFSVLGPFTITASAGPGGSISPSGPTSVPCGGGQVYAIAALSCNVIADVLVDNVSVGPVASYTFTDVQANHTISASFAPAGPYTINAAAGVGGSITPSGLVSVNCGDDQTFTISAADKCHFIADVIVDGNSVGAVGTYTFTNVQLNHTISASFGVLGPFTITATAGPNGTISPSGAVSVPCGANQSFAISANVGYTIQDVLVDNVSVGPTGSYTFIDVQANHTIAASFAALSLPVHDITSGMNYPTIQSAINDVTTLNGHTIVVDPGTYPENVVLNKSLIFKGAQAGASACGRVSGPPNPATESIVTAAGRIWELRTGCAGSVIDGFSFSGGSRSIESTSGPLNNVQINNNHFTGFTGNAIFLNDPGTDVTLNGNNVDGASRTGGDGSIHLDTDGFAGFWLTNNCIGGAPSAPVGSGFFVDGNHNVVPSAGRAPKIDGNILEKHITNVGANLGSRAFNRGTISNNTIRDNAFDGIQGGIQDSRITGNKFLNNKRWGLALTSFASLAVDRGGQRDTIVGNTFTNNDSAGYFISATQAAGNAASCHANFNDIAGNGVGAGGTRYGAIYRGTETIDVGCNWWGDINGPNYPPANPNPAGDKLFASSALYFPWLDSSISSANPQCNQTIKHTITASAGPGGSINPSGAVLVPDGGSQTFTITPADKCHVIADVLVDNVSVGPVSTYTFNNVTADHTISATFSVLGPFTINAIAGPGGSINPSGSVSVNCGDSQTFTFTPSDKCHYVSEVVVDGNSIGAAPSYTFTDVQANHTISVNFRDLGPFTIVASAGPGGSITPSGPVSVPCGVSQTFAISAGDKCHVIADVKVDNVSVGPVSTYTFTDVQADHSIAASFTVIGPYTITASAGPGGSINPSGAVSVNCGESQTFSILAADKCHVIADVKVDNVSVGPVTSYTFLDVQANHTIDASFSVIGPFTILATAGSGGAISPSGSVSVNCGENQTFNITTDKCHVITDVKVDNVSVGAVATYTFVDVQLNHTIDASFTEVGPFTITATAGTGGSIAPSGAVTVSCGASQTFNITPAAGYAIADVKVDNVSQGPLATYTFVDVQANHTIAASFVDTQCPVVTVLAPNGGEILIVGGVTKLSWTATDNSGTVTGVDLWISRDNGNTYLKIASNIPNSGTYTWVVDSPGTNTGPNPEYTALFKVDARDAADNVCSDVSDAPFALQDIATAAMVSMFNASSVGDAIELRWQVGDDHLFSSLLIERSEVATGPWSEVALDRRSESGATVALDRAVTPDHTYYYRLIGITAAGQRVALGQLSGAAHMIITEFAMAKVTPNPSRDLMRIEYALPRESRVRLSVVDIQGRAVAVLADGIMRAGRYQASWSGQTDRGDAPAGVYFVRISALGKTLTQRIVRTR